MAKRNGKTAQQATGWQNRIVGEGTEAPDQLLANPANWRIHPKPQQDALTAVLDNVGWVQRVIVNKRTGHIVDGHLRVEMAISRNEPGVPVLYVDLSEDEERTILATLDPLSGMAVTDDAQLSDLLASIATEDAAVRALLEQIGQERGAIIPDVEFKEFDESAADDVKMCTCPNCGHEFPA